MTQLKLGDHIARDSASRPFLTDPEIVARLREVEALLRSVPRTEQPLATVERAADELHRLSTDLLPEEAQR